MKGKRVLLVLILLSLGLLLSACAAGGNNASRNYDEALSAMTQGNYDEAAKKLEPIFFYEDSAQLIQFCRAHALAEAGDYAGAITMLGKLGDYREADRAAIYYRARSAEAQAATCSDRGDAARMYERDSIGGYRDAAARAAALREGLRQEGQKAEEEENWPAAEDAFGAISDETEGFVRYWYAAGRQSEAEGAGNVLQYARAVKSYDFAGEYADSADRKAACLKLALAEADSRIAAAEFDRAEEIYNALGDFCEESRKTALAKAREQAEEAARQVKIDEGKALLEQKRFDEAAALFEECDEQELLKEVDYLRAEDLAEQGQYAEAAELFRKNAGYKDARERSYQLGVSLMDTQPETAAAIFLKDRDYSEAEEMLYRIAVNASEGQNYSLSTKIYNLFKGTKDCTVRLYNDLYLYGRSLLESGSAGRAAEIFDSLQGIGDADAYETKARYAAAAAMQEAGDFETAADAFDLIENYQDAKDRADQCRYSLAEEKKKNGDYAGAEKIFLALGDLRDSGAQALECGYLSARALEDSGDWAQAIEKYQSLEDYSDSKTHLLACWTGQGEKLLASGDPEAAYAAFVKAGNGEGMSRAAFWAGEAKTAEYQLEDALAWYQKAADLPETESRAVMMAQSLLNMDEDELSEGYASIAPNSELAKSVLYTLALRSLERKDETAAMRLMRKAGDSGDASERFMKMLNSRVETLLKEEKYEEAIALCSVYGDQQKKEEILELKAQKEEEERQRALKEEEEKRRAEEEARAEAEARKKAQEEAQAEAEAKKKAEEKARAEAEAKKKAEEEARAEAEAKKKAEEEAEAKKKSRGRSAEATGSHLSKGVGRKQTGAVSRYPGLQGQSGALPSGRSGIDRNGAGKSIRYFETGCGLRGY